MHFLPVWRSFVAILIVCIQQTPGMSPPRRALLQTAMQRPGMNMPDTPEPAFVRPASVSPEPAQARVLAIRQRIARQREDLASQLGGTLSSQHERGPAGPLPVIGIGVALAGFAFLLAHRRARVIAQATVSAGWLLWRALRLARALSAALAGQSTRENDASDQGRTRAS